MAKTWKTDATQTLLDLSEYLLEAGLGREVVDLIDGVSREYELGAMAGYLRRALSGAGDVAKQVGIAYPVRAFEEAVLKKVLSDTPTDDYACYLLGCLLYGKSRSEEAKKQFLLAAESGDYAPLRCLAALEYSAYGDVAQAQAYMQKADALAPKSEKQITFERAYLMAKTGEDAHEIAEYLERKGYDRDDLTVELARAYNHAGMPQKAVEAA